MKYLNGTLSRSILATNALQQIRNDIILRKYEPGTKLTELLICEKYGISRSPARQIMQQLENEGMLKMLDNGCKYVVGFTKNDLISLYELRDYYEITAVKTLFRTPVKTYSPLISLLSELDKMKNEEDINYIELDVDFHRAIIAMADNKYILSAYENIAPILYTIFLISITTYKEQFFSEFNDRHNILIKSIIGDTESDCIAKFKEHHEYALNKALLIMDKIES